MSAKPFVTAWLALLLIAAWPATPAAAQEDFAAPQIGIGYVANGPQMLLGGTVWGLIPGLRGWGLYVDAKMDTDDPSGYDGFEPDITAATADPGDLEVGKESRWWGFNVAVVKAVTPELHLYAGGGWSKETAYQEFVDGAEELGVLGFYWVEDEAASSSGANVLVGGLLRLAPNVRLQFGGETNPLGYTVGASITFPGR